MCVWALRRSLPRPCLMHIREGMDRIESHPPVVAALDDDAMSDLTEHQRENAATAKRTNKARSESQKTDDMLRRTCMLTACCHSHGEPWRRAASSARSSVSSCPDGAAQPRALQPLHGAARSTMSVSPRESRAMRSVSSTYRFSK